ncbi:MAG TPA: glycine oxidase ThiO [Pyrinomonadaceae bacterium]|nr:glycine oxidase ThiO [Pyrinomonadaceae bacterium]
MFISNKEISDVLVVGGGVIGMSIARALKKNGAGEVTVLDSGRLGQEASSAAAGMLTAQADAEKRDDLFDLCYEGRGLYEGFAQELKAETGIDIELETSGTLSVSFNKHDSRRLDNIYSWQNAAGLPVQKLDTRELLELEPRLSSEVKGGLFFPRDVQVENRLLVKALAASLKQLGVRIVENTPVTSLLVENGKIAGVETPVGNFSAPIIVLAAGAWSSLIPLGGPGETERNRSLSLDVIPVRGQMISFQPGKRLFTRVIMSLTGYLVPRADNRLLAGATVEKAGFDKNVTTSGLESLSRAAFEIAPELKKIEISEKWAGLRPCAADMLPVIGQYDNIGGLYVATGHYRNGILLAPITAHMLLAQITDGQNSKFSTLLRPGRFTQAVSV